MNATILIVDDEPEILRLLRVVMEKEGYAVAETDSGRDVENLVAEFRPDLVLLDVMLPDRNGYDVCQSLKSNAESRHIPILMLTALRGRAEEARALEAGADDFLSKPIDREQLLGRVRAHLRVRRLYSELDASRREVERLMLDLMERTAERDKALSLLEAGASPDDRLDRLASRDHPPDNSRPSSTMKSGKASLTAPGIRGSAS